jgi:hypothetical protein
VRIAGDGAVYDVVDLECTLVAADVQPVAGDDAASVLFADGSTLDRLSCTPLLVETLRSWGVAPG